MKIILGRHGRPALGQTNWIAPRNLPIWIAEFNAVGIWLTVFRLAWYCGYSHAAESFTAASKRATLAADRLIDLAQHHSSVFVVGHGIMMSLIASRLLEKTVQDPKSQPSQVPPDVARYLAGVQPEGKQFDFLIGDWNIAGARYKPDGSTLMQYRATWNAKSLNEGRIIVDDFKAYAPTGQAVSSRGQCSQKQDTVLPYRQG